MAACERNGSVSLIDGALAARSMLDDGAFARSTRIGSFDGSMALWLFDRLGLARSLDRWRCGSSIGSLARWLVQSMALWLFDCWLSWIDGALALRSVVVVWLFALRSIDLSKLNRLRN